VKLIGRASASQVIAAYRHDFVVTTHGRTWPDASSGMPLEQLPIARLAVLVDARRPVFSALECVWDLYEYDPVMLLDDVRHMWSDPPYQRSLRALVDDIALGKRFVTVDEQQRIAPIRERARAGTLEFGDLVAVTGEVYWGQASMAGVVCLLEGHHRVIACALENKLPSRVRVLVGAKPFPLGIAVLNGH
jgi:hypothetical protein